MKKIYYFLLLSFFWGSCSDDNKIDIIKSRLIVNSPKSFTNLKEFNFKGSSFYYTFDFRTRKKIVIYSAKGSKINEISTTKFTNENSCEFFDLIIENPNRYLFLTKDNRIYITDKNLKILKLHTYFNLLHSGLRLAPYTYLHNNTYRTAILASWPDGQTFKTDSSAGQFLHNQPIIAEINLSNGKIKMVGKGIVGRYLKPLELDLTGIHYHFSEANDYTYISPFTDTVYTISKAGKINAKLKIESNIGITKCPSLKKTDLMQGSEVMLRTFISSSFPDLSLYDKYRKLNYLIIRRPKKNHTEFPFNILIYNQKWEKLDEQEFKGDTYRMIFLVTKEGLLMERPNNKSEKRVFDCLKYFN